MSMNNCRDAIQADLILRAYATQTAGAATTTAIEAGPLRESGGNLVINVGVVAATATLIVKLQGSADNSAWNDVYTSETFSAVGTYHLPVQGDRASDVPFRYWRVVTTVANDAISHGEYLAF